MSISEQDTIAALLAWLREFTARFTNFRLYDERKTIPPHLVLEFGNHGLFGLQVEKAHGGLGLGTASTLTILQQLGAIDLTAATLVVNNDFLGVRPFDRFASPELRDRHLHEFASGRRLISYALSEPDAGSNPQSIRGRGSRAQTGAWSLTADKMWIGNAAWATHVNLFVNTSPSGPPALTAFNVPLDARGVSLGAELPTMGMRAMIQSRIHFREVAVTDAQLLGELGQGTAVANDAMMYTRLTFGAAFLGAIKRCLQIASFYAKQRNGLTSGNHLQTPLTRSRLWNGVCRAVALEQLLRFCADCIDREQTVPLDALVTCKILSAEYLWRTVDDCVQILGGRGYLETSSLARFLRDARVARLYEGPTETLLHHLGTRAHKASPALSDLLGRRLESPQAQARLNQKCVEWRERAERDPNLGGRDADAWVAQRAGVLTSKLLIEAIANTRAPSAELRAWLAAEVVAAENGELNPDLTEYAPAPATLLERIEEYKLAVGSPARGRFEEEVVPDSALSGAFD